MNSEQMKRELDRLAVDAERLGHAYSLSGGDEKIQAMCLLVNERWQQLRWDYQLAKATGR